MNIDDIIADFDLLEDWEDRYRYVIELGRKLPSFADADRTELNRVRGCASQVWLTSRVEASNGEDVVLRFSGDSDALIVRGLVAIALTIFDRQSARSILATDAAGLFKRLGLSEHLTAQRANGLAALVARIKRDAAIEGEAASRPDDPDRLIRGELG